MSKGSKNNKNQSREEIETAAVEAALRNKAMRAASPPNQQPATAPADANAGDNANDAIGNVAEPIGSLPGQTKVSPEAQAVNDSTAAAAGEAAKVTAIMESINKFNAGKKKSARYVWSYTTDHQQTKPAPHFYLVWEINTATGNVARLVFNGRVAGVQSFADRQMGVSKPPAR